MKVFLSILTFYFLGLAILPSSNISVHLFSSCQNEKCEAPLAAEKNQDKDCNQNPCTPLCECICCVNVINFPELLVLEIEEPTSPSLQRPLFQPQIEGILATSDIWQPPKMG